MLLYELLTAQPAFDAETLGKAALDEVLRFIRRGGAAAPIRPADDVVGGGTGHGGPMPSSPTGQPPEAASRRLGLDRNAGRGEGAKQPLRDGQRLGSGHPTLLGSRAGFARPPSQLYRFQKVVRRNRVAFAAGSMVLAALILGLGVSTWLFLRERAARQRAVTAEATAKTEAAKSARSTLFLQGVLKGVGPAVARGRDTKVLREILDETAAGVTKDLTAQPEVEAELRGTLGSVYEDVGDYDKAESMDRAALALRRKSSPESLKVADCLNNLANVFYRQGKLTNAEAMHREALGMRRKLLGSKHVKVADSLNNLAEVLQAQSKFREAEAIDRDALAMRRELLGDNSQRHGRISRQPGWGALPRRQIGGGGSDAARVDAR